MTATNKITLKNPTGKKEVNMENALSKMLKKESETKTAIELFISDSFKVNDPDAIEKIKQLLIKSLSGTESYIPDTEFVPAATENEVELKSFDDKEHMALTIWEVVNKSKSAMCSIEVYEKISKKWAISKAETNGVLVMRPTWFRKLKKKLNEEGNLVYFYRAKA